MAPDSARSKLLANPATKEWHQFGMEWKEHIAWISPILATVVAFIVLYYGTNLIRHDRVRRTDDESSLATCSGCSNATTNPASKSSGQLDST